MTQLELHRSGRLNKKDYDMSSQFVKDVIINSCRDNLDLLFSSPKNPVVGFVLRHTNPLFNENYDYLTVK